MAKKTRPANARTPNDRRIVVRSADGGQYESFPTWMGARHWEVAETTRLNEAHWANVEASDTSINDWLLERLARVRAQSIYEARQNGTISGIVQTLADDVVGPDGPTLEVQSDDQRFNDAAERLWREWFAAPTFRPNFSGASLLRLWIRNLPRCGEFLAQITTDPRADGPVKMRLRPKHPRDLASPVDRINDRRIVMGVEFENAELDRPARYWINRPVGDGSDVVCEPWPADLVIHEFVAEEEGQARGFPWLTPSLQPAADLRDYDDQVQDAARQMADQSGLLYTENPDEPWMAPETSTIERRTIKMAPPGWKPFIYPATLPPVQYPDYRAERQREIGRPLSMPLMIMRLDASRHNYSSARFDGQGWARYVQWIQYWLSGTDRSCGTLSRLVDLVLAEARFAIPEVRNRPQGLWYQWTWPARPHVDPAKEAAAAQTRLTTRQSSLTAELAERGISIDTHISTLVSERKAFEAAGLPLPEYMLGPSELRAQAVDEALTDDGDDEDADADDKDDDQTAAENRADDDRRSRMIYPRG